MIYLYLVHDKSANRGYFLAIYKYTISIYEINFQANNNFSAVNLKIHFQVSEGSFPMGSDPSFMGNNCFPGRKGSS